MDLDTSARRPISSWVKVSEWFLVDEEMLLGLTEKMNAVLVDTLKTTIVQDFRCMTTWVLRKRRNISTPVGRSGLD